MMTNSHFHVPQNPDEAVWFDVGVFKTLFSEVSHYFLGGDSDHTTGAIGSRPPNTKEVKKYIGIVLPHFLLLQTYQSFSHPDISSDGPLLSSRGSFLGLRTTKAERSRNWLQVRPTGSESQALTPLVRETSAQSVSSRPANLVSLERPLLSRFQRWHMEKIDRKAIRIAALAFILSFVFFCTGKWFGTHYVGGSHLFLRPHPWVFHVHGGEEQLLHKLRGSRSNGFHSDLPWHKDVLLCKCNPPGQRPHRLLCLQPSSCCLPHSCQERAGLRPGNTDPLDSGWVSYSYYSIHSFSCFFCRDRALNSI